jgi:tetratricopeptide (TPR) repeat protein
MTHLLKAQHCFQCITGESKKSAEKMVDAVISEIGICFADTGQLSKAISLFEEEIKKAERLGDKRGVAVLKNNLANVYGEQGNYTKALDLLFEGKRIFEELSEPRDVAAAWHQIGLTYRRAGRFQQAERPYKEALAIEVREQDFRGEARTLDELGILYSQMERFEESVTFSKQAGSLRHKLGDLRAEGISRSNLAVTLIELRRYDDARQELQRAIECKLPYGHTAETWKTWHILYELDKAVGHLQSAAQARQRAIESFLAYRRDGGQSTTHGANLCAQIVQSIKQENTAELEQSLAQISEGNAPTSFKLLVSKLQAILRGDHHPAHADDPNLDFSDAVELRLLLEVIGVT